MKVSQAVDFHLQYHRANSKNNTVKTCEFVLSRFLTQFGKRELASISPEEILTFLLSRSGTPVGVISKVILSPQKIHRVV